MSIRAILPDGEERRYDDTTALEAAARSGELPADSLIYHLGEERWVSAEQHPALSEYYREERSAGTQADLPDSESSEAEDETKTEDGAKEYGPPPWLSAVSWAGIVVVATIWAAGDPAVSAAEKFGVFLGAGLSMLLFPGLFLVWSKRTRPYIPVIGVVFGAIALWGRVSDQAEEQATRQKMLSDVERYVEQVDEPIPSLDSVEPPSSASTTLGDERPGPEQPSELVGASKKTRVLWVLRNTIRDLWGEAMVEGFGSIDDLPDDYLQAPYMANARDYPSVERSLEQQQAWVEGFEDRYGTLIDSLIAAYGQQADLSGDIIDQMRNSATSSFSQTFHEEDAIWPVYRAFLSYGLQFHRFLESADPRVYHDAEAGIARFERDDERRRAILMADSIQTLSQRFYRRWQRRRKAMRANLDTMRALFGEP